MPEFKFDLFNERNEPLGVIDIRLDNGEPVILDLWGHDEQEIVINFIINESGLVVDRLQINSANLSKIKFSVDDGKKLKINNLAIINADIIDYGQLQIAELEVFGDCLSVSSSPNVTTITAHVRPDPDDQAIKKLLRGTMLIPGCGVNCYGESAINQLRELRVTYPKLEWISPVVAWFGNSMKAGECLVYPGIENTETNTWGGIGHQITKDLGKLRYGGTPSDESVIDYLKKAKGFGYKIMLNPMLFMDVAGKEWRGRLTGRVEDVERFYQQYKNFILHYARLCAANRIVVDAFLIGSELIGMTKIYQEVSGDKKFPFVDKLIELAGEVKKLLPNAKVSYAADWSEYHHTDGGWRNLDPLWASPNIDFVGIDNYVPITNNSTSRVTEEEIKSGLTSGDQYNCYYNGSEICPMNPEWGNKAFQVWWEREHFNPGGKKTLWEPKMKKIWFTEFGFPSIGMATNQPNVFFNPECKDGGVPKYSHSKPDNRVQKIGIRAVLEECCEGGYRQFVEQAFLYCLDTRGLDWHLNPYWADRILFKYGHWCDGKIGRNLSLEYNGNNIELTADCRPVILQNNPVPETAKETRKFKPR